MRHVAGRRVSVERAAAPVDKRRANIYKCSRHRTREPARNVNIESITAERVFKALKLIRSAGRLSASPLVDLDVVRLHLRVEGVHDSPEGRAWMLGTLLDEIIWQRLGQLRGAGQPVSRDGLTSAEELGMLKADFAAGRLDLEAWSLIHARFLSLAQPSVAELADHLGLVRRTLERRAKRGYALLRDALRDAERDASERIGTMPGAPAHARIRVDEPAQAGAAPAVTMKNTIARAIIDSVRDEARVLQLSAEEVRGFANGSFGSVDEYLASRVAEWSLPRFRLDKRFVDLSMLVDAGSGSESERWRSTPLHFEHLTELMRIVDAPAFVLLGSPGCGKSTLLRRLELELAAESLRAGDASRVTYFVQLNDARGLPDGAAWSPSEWLASRWRARHPALPPLESLLATGRVTLLLDALNEIPHEDPAALRGRIIELKDFLHATVLGQPGNRVVVSCRSLDYSAPLSTPHLRVPQVRIEPLDDARVRKFLRAYSPRHCDEIWRQLDGSPQLEVLRNPFFLRLLTEQVEPTGAMPEGRADLFTGFVRQALRREVELENPLFAPDGLLSIRDVRRITHWRWGSPRELPEHGLLVPELSRLAYTMQSGRSGAERSQVRVEHGEALEILADERGEDIVRAGVALGALDEDPAGDEVMYVHQLFQEYFAGRALARRPSPELVRSEWRADRTRPSVAEVMDGLDADDPLPGMPQTGWEETTLLAAALADEPEAFVSGVMQTNLVLAGRAAAPLRRRLGADLVSRLRASLAARSRAPEADLRERIACGHALGALGDPRFEPISGPHGDHIVPPMVEIEAGRHMIGDDGPIDYVSGTTSAHVPRHGVELAAFEIGRFPVTNAEWALFMAAAGYEDERWWVSDADRAWRRGQSTAAGIHSTVKALVARHRARPEMMDEMLRVGTWDQEQFERGRMRVAMSGSELDAHLRELYPGGRETEPGSWRDAHFNGANQPVVGVCWHEARAYARWLSVQCGRTFRLPTEAEWEAAARGSDGRRYAYGDAFDRLRANSVEAHIRRTTPVGVFPEGDSPAGASDMTGNVWEWTSTAFGTEYDEPAFGYPYRADDGREAPDLGVDVRRVMHGGSWLSDRARARTAFRYGSLPIGRSHDGGVRLVLEVG